MAKTKKSFEDAMARLETIVQQMELGNAPLDEALSLFEEATDLVKQCSKQLDEAEMKVVRLMKGADGEPVETEFNHED